MEFYGMLFEQLGISFGSTLHFPLVSYEKRLPGVMLIVAWGIPQIIPPARKLKGGLILNVGVFSCFDKLFSTYKSWEELKRGVQIWLVLL